MTGLYVKIDDDLGGRARLGRPPMLSDSELVCLAVAQALLGFAPKRTGCVRARSTWRRVPLPAAAVRVQQAAAGRGSADQAADPGAGQVSDFWLDDRLDRGLHPGGVRHVAAHGRSARTWPAGPAMATAPRTPVLLGAAAVSGVHPGGDAGPVGACRSRSSASGRCSPRCWRWRPTWPPTAWTGHRSPTRASSGRDFERLAAELASRCCAPHAQDEQPATGEPMLKKVRQLIESVNDTLKGQLDLEAPRRAQLRGRRRPRRPAHPGHGRRHLAQQQDRRPVTRSLIAYDH